MTEKEYFELVHFFIDQIPRTITSDHGDVADTLYMVDDVRTKLYNHWNNLVEVQRLEQEISDTEAKLADLKKELEDM